MSYFLHEFDSLAIPLDLGSGSHDITLGERRSPLIEVPGGVYDPLGTDQAPRRSSRLSARILLIGATSADVRTALDAWSAKVGKRGNLIRISDAGLHQTAVARLVDAKAARQAENIRLLPLSLTWDVLSPVWSGAAHSDTTALDTNPKNYTLTNNGNATVANPIITVTAGTTPITLLVIVGVGGVLRFNQTIGAGVALVIDCGAKSVKRAGTDLYAGFSLDSNWHTIDEWMIVGPGTTAARVDLTGGGTDSSINWVFSDGWS